MKTICYMLFYSGLVLIELSFFLISKRSLNEKLSKIYRFISYQICRVIPYLILVFMIYIIVWNSCILYMDIINSNRSRGIHCQEY
jgi:hypothetical protein